MLATAVMVGVEDLGRGSLAIEEMLTDAEAVLVPVVALALVLEVEVVRQY